MIGCLMDDVCSEVFKQKTTENFQAFVSLYEKNFLNAASNRIYYCLIHAVLSKAFKSGSAEDCYRIDSNGQKKIDKSTIEGSPGRLGIKKYIPFRLLMNRAKRARIKSDYLSSVVIKEDLGENIIEQLRMILKQEGFL
jgi:hypothetical protein